MEYLKSREEGEDPLEKLEMLVYRINFFMQNPGACAETVLPNTDAKQSPHQNRKKDSEQQMIEKLSQKYQTELGKLSLSQRERLVFNYINQSTAQEDLKDVSAEEVMQVTGKEENERERRRQEIKRMIQEINNLGDIPKRKREQNEEGARIFRSKSVDDLHSEPEDEEGEDDGESEGESGENGENSEILSIEGSVPDSGSNDDDPPQIEVAIPAKQSENKKEVQKIQRQQKPEERPYCANPPRDIVSQRIMKIKKTKVTIIDKNAACLVSKKENNQSFVLPHAPKDPPLLPPARQQRLVVPRLSPRNVWPIPPARNQPTVASGISCKSGGRTDQASDRVVDTSRSKEDRQNYCYKSPLLQPHGYDSNENASVVVSKNYGDQHSEVNVNISIMNGKIGNRVRHHVAAALIPVRKPQRPKDAKQDRMSARSHSAKSIGRAQIMSKESVLGRLKDSINSQLRLIDRNVSPGGANHGPYAGPTRAAKGPRQTVAQNLRGKSVPRGERRAGVGSVPVPEVCSTNQKSGRRAYGEYETRKKNGRRSELGAYSACQARYGGKQFKK